MSSRRSPLEIYRDALLVLSMETEPMKRTNFMYALQMSWIPFGRLVEDLVSKKLAEKIDPYEYQRSQRSSGNPNWRQKVDGRTKFLVTITMKGQYVLRWLDELLKYIQDSSDPHVRPPLWILQTLFRHRIEDLSVGGPNPFGVMQRPLDINMPGLQFKLMPPVTAGERNLQAKFVIAEVRFLGAKITDPQDRIFTNWTEEISAEFILRRFKPPEYLFCPECGQRCRGIRGIKVHVGRIHEEKKVELIELAQSMHNRRRG